MKTKITFFISIVFCGTLFAQNITNTLGTSGLFRIRDNTNIFFTLNQSNGTIDLIGPLAGNQRGSIFKGGQRFLHTYFGSGTAGFNTFLGINSGNFTMGGISSVNGSYNTAVGHSSLSSLTTGFDNSAFGYISLLNNTTGNYNSAFGYSSLYSNTTGSSNSAFGNWSLTSNTTGNGNSAFGTSSLYSNTTGEFNTAVGLNAGWNITTGSNNIAIGNSAQVPTGTASNQIRLGNTSITYAGIQVAWTITSDRRYKDNIKSLEFGLGFISKLNPVSYTRKNDENHKTEYGLIAQEVEEVLKSEGIENHAMLTVTDEGMYELRYNDLLAPMIKAIQELKMKNEELKVEKDSEIAKLREENENLKAQLNDMKDLKEKVTFMEKVLNELKQNQNEVKEVKMGENIK
jgi:hypothetical protein